MSRGLGPSKASPRWRRLLSPQPRCRRPRRPRPPNRSPESYVSVRIRVVDSRKEALMTARAYRWILSAAFLLALIAIGAPAEADIGPKVIKAFKGQIIVSTDAV